MLKYILFVFNIVALLVYKLLTPDGLEIRQNLPATVEINKEYIVELTINKGSVQGFGKFQEDLPRGFSAEAIETRNGAFSFLDNSVKIIWMTLPGDAEFTVKYKIIVGADASGESEITPKFSYFTGNEKTTFNLESSFIKVGSGAGTETASNETKKEEPVAQEQKTPEEKKEGGALSLDTVIKPANSAASEQKKEGGDQAPVQNNGSATCTRQINNSNPKEIIVEVTISKGENTQFGKLEETLPVGFTASALETNNGTFAFVDQKAKFSWLALPEEESFKVSYKVIPLDPANKSCTIEGLFSYLEKDGESKKNTIPAMTVSIGPVEKEEVKEEAKEEQKNTDNTAQNNTTESKKEKENSANTVSNETKKEPQLTNIPNPQKGIIYRVQITATHKTGVEPVYFRDTYKLNEEIYAEMHQGWYKFTVGSFDTYNNARDKRENIHQNIPELASLGPFVTAYNNGTRITIQEALMISSQSWVK
jgi:hypothetical protein